METFENITYSQIFKLTPDGLKLFKFLITKAFKWESRYDFILTEDGSGYWWSSKTGGESGEAFKTLGECKLSAFIHWCNNNPDV